MRWNLRDLFWLILVAGIAAGWWRGDLARRVEVEKMERMAEFLKQKELIKRIELNGGISNIHFIDYVYSEWYGTEVVIGWNKTSRGGNDHFFLENKSGKVQEDFPGHWTMIPQEHQIQSPTLQAEAIKKER